MGLSGGGGIPAVQQPPSDNSEEVRAAALKERQLRAQARGRDSTILGGAQENATPDSNVSKNTLLGGNY